MKIAKTIWAKTRALRVAVNMLACALAFGFFGARPRETVSGFIGRMSDPDQLEYSSYRRRRIRRRWRWARKFVDLITLEPGHCWRCADEESTAHLALYGSEE